jgi:hypothetical protein
MRILLSRLPVLLAVLCVGGALSSGVGMSCSAETDGPPSEAPNGNARDARLHGIHWMVGPRAGLEGSETRFERLLAEVDRNLSTNRFVTGVYIITHWGSLEPTPGRLVFDRLDRLITLVRKHGRYFKLSVNPGIYAPGWLYESGAAAFETVGSNPARKDIYQQKVRIPIPWDPAYATHYFRLLEAVAERYGSVPNFRAVVLTVATFMSPEWHLPHSREDRKKWRELPGFPEKLEQAWKDGIDRFARLFPGQVLVLEASSYPVGLRTLGDSVVDHGATKHAGRFAVQINQLTGRFDQRDRPTYRKLIDYRRKYGSTLLIGLQNLKGFSSPRLREQQGSLEMTTYNFVQADGGYWELWFGDGKDRGTCEALDALRRDALRGGLDAYRERLQREGTYRPVEPHP